MVRVNFLCLIPLDWPEDWDVLEFVTLPRTREEILLERSRGTFLCNLDGIVCLNTLLIILFSVHVLLLSCLASPDLPVAWDLPLTGKRERGKGIVEFFVNRSSFKPNVIFHGSFSYVTL